MTRLVVFDFDGVVADSEVIANAVLAEFVTEMGAPTTVEDSLRDYTGRRLADVLAEVEGRLGRPLVPDAVAEFQRRTLARLRCELRAVAGVRGYLDALGGADRCIASASSPDRLAACLDVLGLANAFGKHVYSATMVPRGKPHPDLFWHAAAQFGVDPRDAIVIEDSANGVRAGVAAGMLTIGFLGGSHIREGDEKKLRAAGAHHIARDYADVAAITRLQTR
ncbi:MAG: HAD-IA family hydrolase [Betaproteobacteria bacterium]